MERSKNILLDEHGQPLNVSLNRSHREARSTNETLGLLRGILADGQVSDSEITALADWLCTNREHADVWPFNILARRICEVYADGRIDEEERSDLHAIMTEILGTAGAAATTPAATAIPFTQPSPDVVFDENVFVMTGRFAYGIRRDCEREITSRGGRCSDNVTLQTSYVVIGAYGSRDWRHSAFGVKILKAVEYSMDSNLAIVSEEHWSRYLLPDSAPA